MNIRKTALLFSLLGAGAVLPLQGAACGAASAATYVGLGATGCTIGSWTFSNFGYVSLGNGPDFPDGGLPATQTLITPLSENGVGIMFTPTVAWGTAGTGFSDVELRYIVTFTGNITSLFQSISGTVAGGSFANITDTYCPGGTTLPPGLPCNPVPTLSTNLFSPGGTASNSVGFAGVNSVSVIKDVSADGRPTNGGTVTITQFTNCFNGTCSAVPEPGSYGMAAIGIGLLALRALKLRRSA